MGNIVAKKEEPQLIVQRSDGVIMPVKVASADNKSAVIVAPNGEKQEVVAVQKRVANNQGNVSEKTILVPINKPYAGGLDNLIVLGMNPIVVGNQPTRLCFVTENKDTIVGYTNDGKKCNIFVNNEPKSVDNMSIPKDDGLYRWTRTPTNGVAFGTIGGKQVPVCAINGLDLIGHVVNGRCVVTNHGGKQSAGAFDYLDHPV